jgi:hypothetical protein
MVLSIAPAFIEMMSIFEYSRPLKVSTFFQSIHMTEISSQNPADFSIYGIPVDFSSLP